MFLTIRVPVKGIYVFPATLGRTPDGRTTYPIPYEDIPGEVPTGDLCAFLDGAADDLWSDHSANLTGLDGETIRVTLDEGDLYDDAIAA